MRISLLALMLLLTWTPLSAQTEREPRKATKAESTRGDMVLPERKLNPKAHTAQPSETRPRPKADDDRHRHRERDRERQREQKPPPSAREQTGPMNLRPTPPANKQFSAHPSETRPRPTAPSPAEQMQRQTEQQRRVEQGRPGGTQQAVFQCSARPVCGGGGYGTCAGVQQTYRGGTEQSRRQDIVNDCIQANTPDTCHCAVQCRRLARCSIF